MKTLPPISTAFTRLQLVLEQRQVSLTLLHTYRISTRLTPFFPTLTYRSPTFFFSFLSFFPPFFFPFLLFSHSPRCICPRLKALHRRLRFPLPPLSRTISRIRWKYSIKEHSIKKERRKENKYIYFSFVFLSNKIKSPPSKRRSERTKKEAFF